ncbi:putative secreted protein [Rhodopirellula maiorica SM1]|uniref:Putative secreted protein n=1 Tax=Rhodopirellula maiorica SM1 TaxID=1265738 RepID=M5R9C9_9BACT|nr:hypothetical protein [Rhodopirellula maiorica]EMI15980.1 putative secreted protein [Rhodopirellula maiorica SM1]
MRFSLVRRGVVAATLLLLSVSFSSGDFVNANEPAVTMELFEAIDSKQVSVQFIALDANHANVLVENHTDHVLHLKLPNAIAAVPVLGQFGFGGQQAGFGAAQGQGGQSGGNQSVGGGFQQGAQQGGNAFGNNGFGNNLGGGNARQGNGFGMGFMRIAAQKTRKLVATTVCLEQGKPEPNAKVKYRMIPIDQYTQDARLIELCQQLALDNVSQKVAQAVAWHYANGLSWEKLAKLNRIESRYLGNVRMFRAQELNDAKTFAEALEASSREVTHPRPDASLSLNSSVSQDSAASMADSSATR